MVGSRVRHSGTSRSRRADAPILVTGMHRSGTTWIASMLRASGQVVYISEPLNIRQERSILGEPVEHWYTYIGAGNEARFLPQYEAALRLSPRAAGSIRAVRSHAEAIATAKRRAHFVAGRLGGRRVLIRDAFAVFSADWFSERLGCRVVISVRHPAAVVSSLKRLGWTFDFEHLLRQPLLLRDRLKRFRGEMEAALRSPDDVIGQGSLLWRMIYAVVADLSAANRELCVVRQEDLSREPVARYSELYSILDLRFSRRARRRVAAASDASNPKEVSLSDPFDVRLDSRANLENWRRRLSRDEVSRVHALTEGVASLYYTDKDWEL